MLIFVNQCIAFVDIELLSLEIIIAPKYESSLFNRYKPLFSNLVKLNTSMLNLANVWQNHTKRHDTVSRDEFITYRALFLHVYGFMLT